MNLDSSLDWQDGANCATTDPDLFFPDHTPLIEAKAVCAACDVREQCLAYAMEHGMNDGVWGGLSARSRRSRRSAQVAETAPLPPVIHGTVRGSTRCEGECPRDAETGKTCKEARNEYSRNAYHARKAEAAKAAA